MMAEWSMAVTDSKEVLPGAVIYIGIDDEIILIDFARVGWYISFFSSVCTQKTIPHSSPRLFLNFVLGDQSNHLNDDFSFRAKFLPALINLCDDCYTDLLTELALSSSFNLA
jgi:hypothetical protein